MLTSECSLNSKALIDDRSYSYNLIDIKLLAESMCIWSPCRIPKYLHSLLKPPDGDSCGSKKSSGPVEVCKKISF